MRIPHLSQHPSSVGFPTPSPADGDALGAPITVRAVQLRQHLPDGEAQRRGVHEGRRDADRGCWRWPPESPSTTRLFEGARTRHRWMQAVARRDPTLGGNSLVGLPCPACATMSPGTDAVDVVILTSSDDKMVVQDDPADRRCRTVRRRVGCIGDADAIGSSMVVHAADPASRRGGRRRMDHCAAPATGRRSVRMAGGGPPPTALVERRRDCRPGQRRESGLAGSSMPSSSRSPATSRCSGPAPHRSRPPRPRHPAPVRRGHVDSDDARHPCTTRMRPSRPRSHGWSRW